MKEEEPREEERPLGRKSKRILGRDEPGLFDHDVETLGSFKAYGSGLNRLSGPLSLEEWLEIPHRDADPTAWETNEKGRTWFDAANNIFKFWDGAQILSLMNLAPGVVTLTEGAIPFGSSNGYLDEDVSKFHYDAATHSLGVHELRFYEGANYVGFKAPALSADQIWVLPSADGQVNEAMATDGGGNLIWQKSIMSDPPTGDYRIKEIRLNGDKHIVIVYDETPIP